MNYEKFKRSGRPDRFRSYCQQFSQHYPELRSYFTLKSLLHSRLKQVMSLFTLGSARAVLVVALVYSFPDVFNVIMALIYNKRCCHFLLYKQLLSFPVIF
jgi:hypothetical protein